MLSVPKLQPLFTVVTVTEAARIWHKHQSTVRRAIDSPKIISRKSGNTWFLLVDSLREYWGEPLEPFDV